MHVSYKPWISDSDFFSIWNHPNKANMSYNPPDPNELNRLLIQQHQAQQTAPQPQNQAPQLQSQQSQPNNALGLLGAILNRSAAGAASDAMLPSLINNVLPAPPVPAANVPTTANQQQLLALAAQLSSTNPTLAAAAIEQAVGSGHQPQVAPSLNQHGQARATLSSLRGLPNLELPATFQYQQGLPTQQHAGQDQFAAPPSLSEHRQPKSAQTVPTATINRPPALPTMNTGTNSSIKPSEPFITGPQVQPESTADDNPNEIDSSKPAAGPLPQPVNLLVLQTWSLQQLGE